MKDIKKKLVKQVKRSRPSLAQEIKDIVPNLQKSFNRKGQEVEL